MVQNDTCLASFRVFLQKCLPSSWLTLPLLCTSAPLSSRKLHDWVWPCKADRCRAVSLFCIMEAAVLISSYVMHNQSESNTHTHTWPVGEFHSKVCPLQDILRCLQAIRKLNLQKSDLTNSLQAPLNRRIICTPCLLVLNFSMRLLIILLTTASVC